MRFSIIIPVYNAAAHLKACLDSVLSQTCRDFELICVDDGSTDGSAAILDEYTRRDGRIRVIHQVNAGVAAARNRGLDEAVGEYVTWLDADDLMAPWRLELAWEIIEKEHPDLVHFHFTSTGDARAPFVGRMPDRRYSVFVTPHEIYHLGWERMNYRGMVWLWCARREVLLGHRFVEGMRIKEDGIFTLSLIPDLKKVCKSEDMGVYYRQIKSSAMHSLRRAEDCICYQNAMHGIWMQQKDYASSIGCLELLKYRVQRGVGTDVIDWILSHSHDDGVSNSCRVYEAYLQNLTSGAFTGRFVQDPRYRFTFDLYEKFGWQIPIRLIDRIFSFGGRMLRAMKIRPRK